MTGVVQIDGESLIVILADLDSGPDVPGLRLRVDERILGPRIECAGA